MKYLYLIIVFVVSLYSADSLAAGTPSRTLSPEMEKLSKQCNIEARNSLISEDLKLVEDICMQTVTEIEKSDKDREFLINPIMNLAFAYTMAGQFDKATPLYKKARDIRIQLYGADSKKIKEIDKMIENQKTMQKQKSDQ